MLVLILLATVGGIVIGKYFYGGKKVVPPKTETIPTATESFPTTTTATPPPDLTADWKTYNSTRNNFSVKYPQNWFLEDDILSSYKITTQMKPPPSKIAKCDFVKYEKDTYLGISNLKLLKDTSPKITEVSVEYKQIGPGASGPHYLIEKDPNNQLILSCFFFDEEYKPILEKILSTFKFLL